MHVRLFLIVFVVAAVPLYAAEETPASFAAEWKNNPAGIARSAAKIIKEFAEKADKETDFKVLQGLADDVKAVPAVRFNAVLSIGQLDNGKEPYLAALKYLVKFSNDNNTIQYLKAGALLGIVRHTGIGITDEKTKQDVLKLLLATIQVSEERESKSKSSYAVRSQTTPEDWLKQLALEGIAALKILDTKIADALCSLITDTNSSWELRARAVNVFSVFEYKESKLNAAKLAGITASVAALLQDLKETQCGKIDLELNENNSGKMTGSSAEVLNRSYNATKRQLKELRDKDFKQLPKEQQELVQDILIESKMVLLCIMSAAGEKTGGLKSAFTGEDKSYKQLDGLIKEIRGIMKIFDEGQGQEEERRGGGAPRGGRTDVPVNPAAKEGVIEFKVNLVNIREAFDPDWKIAVKTLGQTDSDEDTGNSGAEDN